MSALLVMHMVALFHCYSDLGPAVSPGESYAGGSSIGNIHRERSAIKQKPVMAVGNAAQNVGYAFAAFINANSWRINKDFFFIKIYVD